jgi:ankyrin repeat protein
MGNWKMIDIVVNEMHANILSKMCNDLSVMHCAAQTYTGSLSILILAKLHSFDVNMRDNKEATPLHFATMYKETKNVELLIKFGADLNA